MKNQLKNARAGGRENLPAIELKTKKLQIHLTELEYTKIQVLYHASGKKTLSDFMRALVLDEKKSGFIRNNVELIKHLDNLWLAISRIGNNINQLAKYANIQIKSGKVNTSVIIDFMEVMDKYMQARRELAKAYRALVRNE